MGTAASGVGGFAVGGPLDAAVRAINWKTWVLVLEPAWCAWLAARAEGKSAHPPLLAPHVSAEKDEVYFTNLAALATCHAPEHFAQRLTLEGEALFRAHGAVLVQFPVDGLEYRVPAGGGAPEPHTAGGARQWTIRGNVPLGADQVVFHVAPQPEQDAEAPDFLGGLRWRIAGWQRIDGLLRDDGYCAARNALGPRQPPLPGRFAPASLAELRERIGRS